MIFHFYSDPQHSWLKVARKKLVSLGIEDKISSFSFQRGDFVYLEEDCDAGVFIGAWKDSGKTVTLRQHHTNKQSRLRGYPMYVSTAT